MEMIKCERCWKEIQKLWLRKYCVPCRIVVDYEYQKAKREEQKRLKAKKK